MVQAAAGMLALTDLRGSRFLGRGVRARIDVRGPAHTRQQARCQASWQKCDESTKKARSLGHLVSSTPRTLVDTSMHAGCQRTVTGQNHSTALIVRDLSNSGNGKIRMARNIIFDLTRYGTSTYRGITSIHPPSVTCYYVTGKVLAMRKAFPLREAALGVRQWAFVSDQWAVVSG